MWNGIHFAGGIQLGTLDSCLISEDIAYGCAGISAALLTSNIGVSSKSNNLWNYALLTATRLNGWVFMEQEVSKLKA